MEYKVVVSDPKTGKSYQVDVKDEQARKIRGRKIGDSVEGALVGLPGYKLQVTGGSDRGGFAMRKGIHSQSSSKVLVDKGVGFKAKGGSRARRRLHGEVVGEDVIQVNTKITDYGGKSVEELLGGGEELEGEEKKEPAEEKKEESKPSEQKAESEKKEEAEGGG